MATTQNFVGLPQPNQPPASIIPTQTGVSQGTSSAWNTARTQLQQTPQSELSLAIAQAAEGLGNNFYQWATQQLPADANVTGQSVGRYFDASNKMFGAANTFMDQYNNTYAPEMQQLANTAGEYSSAARQRVNAGRAVADVMQGSNAAKQQNMQQLQSYGINPASGVYQELAQSNNTLAGGAAAAAGTTAAMNTEATGRQLLGESVGVGETLPGAAVNAANTGIAGVSGAENAQLANTTTGAQALQSPNSYFQTAQQLTGPGTTSESSGGSTSQQTSENQGFSYLPRVTQSAAKGGAVGAIPDDREYAGGGAVQHAKTMTPQNFSNMGKMRGTGIMGLNLGGGKGRPHMQHGGGQQRPQQGGGGPGQSRVMPSTGTAHDTGYPTAHDAPSGSDNSGGGGQMMPQMPGGAPGAIPTPDMSAGAGAPDMAFGGAMPGGISHGMGRGGQSSFAGGAPTAHGGGGMSGGGGRAGGGQPTMGFGMGGAMPGALMHQAMVMHKQRGQQFDDGGAAAQDGAIPSDGAPQGGVDGSQAVGGATTGGFVSHSLSPSGGQQTDDIPARLNANEFVIPRDVTAWKGQEFFQKLIAQSRQALQQAQAMPTMGPT